MHRSPRARAIAHHGAAQRPLFILLSLAVVLTGGLLLGGCNTTAGAGQDINSTGAAITRGADAVKSKL